MQLFYDCKSRYPETGKSIKQPGQVLCQGKMLLLIRVTARYARQEAPSNHARLEYRNAKRFQILLLQEMKNKGLSPNLFEVSPRSSLSSITNGLEGRSAIMGWNRAPVSGEQWPSISLEELIHAGSRKTSGRKLACTPITDPKFYVCTGAFYSILLFFWSDNSPKHLVTCC